jgi:hypothetical protein
MYLTSKLPHNNVRGDNLKQKMTKLAKDKASVGSWMKMCLSVIVWTWQRSSHDKSMTVLNWLWYFLCVRVWANTRYIHVWTCSIRMHRYPFQEKMWMMSRNTVILSYIEHAGSKCCVSVYSAVIRSCRVQDISVCACLYMYTHTQPSAQICTKIWVSSTKICA